MLNALKRRLPTLLMVAGVMAWLWPLGLGARMPVGGDVTAFQIGLMAEYQRALHAFRLPVWNALWGFGFPGLAESQMGVYYPPHAVLYGLLPLEAAYTVSLVLHTLWAACGAKWCAQRMGATCHAGAFAGFVFATGGFFLIHITHQWGYTSASWMPWAWGLAWTLIRGNRTRRTWLALAAVLAVQMLPGHFQLAFITQTTVLLIGLWSVVDGSLRKSQPSPASRPRRYALMLLGFAWFSSMLLAACQLRPTWDLARRAESDRSFEYLSGFAQTPLHLVSYVAPGLFHGSPLWRPLAWDPLHTSPEENLGYSGLVPLWLALTVLWRGRREASVRALSWLALGSLILSLGPFVPGFGWLIRVPGFSFFRAPARWSAATLLALALLSAFGLDHIGNWLRLRGSAARFAILALIWPLGIVGLVELAFAGAGQPEVARAFEHTRGVLPWAGDPKFDEVMARARRPSDNPITLTALARRGVPIDARLDRMRHSIYVHELWPSATLILGLLGVVWIWGGRGDRAPRSRALACGLVILSAADVWLTVRLRDVDTGPIRSLVAQSPVLQRLAGIAATERGRVVSGLGNLPMVAGVGNLPAYRTLDIPTMPDVVAEASRQLRRESDLLQTAGAMWMAAANTRVLEPGVASPNGTWRESLFEVENMADPELSRWLSGIALHEAGARFSLLRLKQPAGLVSRSLRPVAADRESPLRWESPTPEVIRVLDVASEEFPKTFGVRVITLAVACDPEWRGTWINEADPQKRTEAVLDQSPGAFLRVAVPETGTHTLELRYEGRAAKAGLVASAAAWGVWLLLWFAPWRRWKRQRSELSGSKIDDLDGGPNSQSGALPC